MYVRTCTPTSMHAADQLPQHFGVMPPRGKRHSAEACAKMAAMSKERWARAKAPKQDWTEFHEDDCCNTLRTYPDHNNDYTMNLVLLTEYIVLTY